MRLLVNILSRLSLNKLYFLSDWLLFPLMYYIVRYRRKVAHQNLKWAFPEKNKDEINAIEKNYYHHLADIFVEIIWGYRATHEEMQKHLFIDNIDEVEQWIKAKNGVFFMLGHLGNWEWTPEVQQMFKRTETQHYNVYREQKNKTVNQLMLDCRNRRSGEGSCIEKNSLIRKLVTLKKSNQPFTLGLISDQKVQPQNMYYRTEFLHQNTSFLGGGEVLSTKFDWAVCYVHCKQEKRGQYRLKLELITLNPANEDKYYITEQFARLLEANIIEQPEQWLWTHKRWKWDRQDG